MKSSNEYPYLATDKDGNVTFTPKNVSDKPVYFIIPKNNMEYGKGDYRKAIK